MNTRNSNGNNNNIITLQEGDKFFEERLGYYAAKLDERGESLFELLLSGKPVLIAEAGKGGGISCDGNGKGINDKYDDRITLITMDKDGNIVIEEYNRANVDTSIRYSDVRSGRNRPVAEGNFDFMVGLHRGKTKALNVFDINNVYKLDEHTRIEILERYNSNSLTKRDIRDMKLDLLHALDYNRQIRWQSMINVHEAYRNYTDSKGCFTILYNDFSRFINNFPYYGQIGKLFLYR